MSVEIIERGIQGPPGPRGEGLHIDGFVQAYTDLDGITPPSSSVYMVLTSSMLYFWDGSTWTSEEDGVLLTGDQGSSILPSDTPPSSLGIPSAGISIKYSRGDHTHKMPTASDVGALENISGLVGAGNNISITGVGTSSSPFVINADVQGVAGESGVWRTGAEPDANSYIDTATATAPEFLALWEQLRADHPGRVSRENIGADSSGLYEIWEYTIAPRKDTRKEIMVTCCVHGGEIMGQLAQLRAIKKLLEGHNENGKTKWFNDHVTLYVIPMVNPWGVSQSPRTRVNSNNVDLNRNTDFFWSKFDDRSLPPAYGTKGSSAFSEIESSILRDRFAIAHPGISAWIDSHSYVDSSGNNWRYAIYTPYWGLSANRQAVRGLVDRLLESPDLPVLVTSEDPNPNWANWAANAGLEACTAEWDLGSHGGGRFSSNDMTKSVEWYGNLLLLYGTGMKGSEVVTEAPSAVTIKGGKVYVAVGEPKSGPYPDVIPETTFYVETDSIVQLTGWVVLEPSQNEDRVWLSPVLGQDGMIPVRYRASSSASEFITHEIPKAGQRMTVPLGRTIPVRGGNRAVRVGLKAASRDSGAVFSRFYISVIVTPLSGKKTSLLELELVDGQLRQRAPYFESADGSITI